MMRPIEFRKGQKINLNLLKSEIDRQINLITMMVKGIKGTTTNKSCSDKCCQVNETYCQTEQPYHVLNEIPNLTLSNTPSMKSLKSPNNLKRSSSIKNKQNQVIQSFSITSKSKKLKPILQSENEALRTSRYKLQSDKKKVKKLNMNQQTSKKTNRSSVLRKKNNESNYVRDDLVEVVSSFQSAKKFNLSQRKSFKNFSTKNINKFTTAQKHPTNFSINSSVYDLSKSNTKTSIRNDSMGFNDSFVINSSSNIPKKQTQSFSTNNMSSTFVSDYLNGECMVNGVKRMNVGEEVRLSIQSEFENRVENLKKKTRQPKTNNIRISLLKRLEDKYEKTIEDTK